MPSNLLKNKIVLITGGSRGIGRAIAIEAAQEGAFVIFTFQKDREAAKETERLISNLGMKAIAVQLDIENSVSTTAVLNSILSQFKIDILINNAAYLFRSHFLNTKPEDLDKVYRINLKGPFEIARLVAANMIKNKTSGAIINISSDRDTTLTDELSAYQIMKAGLNMMTLVLARALAKYNIRVNTIAPGMVKTDMHRHLWQHNLTIWQQREKNIPLQRAARPEEIAKMVIFTASDNASYMTGSRILIDGGRTVGASNEELPAVFQAPRPQVAKL